MKVLHILDHSLPLHSGYAFRSYNIFNCQKEKSLLPIVITSPKHEAATKGNSQSEEIINGVKYFRTGRIREINIPFIKEIFIVKMLERKIYEVSIKEKPDIIHAHSPVLNAIAATRVSKALNIPVIYEIRAFWEDAAVDHGTYGMNSLRYRIVRNLETYVCRKVQKVLTICEGLKNDLLNRGISSDKIEIIPNAIDAENFVPVDPDQEYIEKYKLQNSLVVGFIGSFYHYEGLDLLLEATSDLLKSLPALKILLVGGGPMEKELRRQTKKLCLQNNVIFTGRLSHEIIPNIYSVLDILVFPRKLMRLTDIVTPLKPLEAMLMKKVVVASDVGGHKELIRDGETGFLFKADDVNDLMKIINILKSNPQRYEKIVQNAYQWVISERSWSGNAQIYYKIYKSFTE